MEQRTEYSKCHELVKEANAAFKHRIQLMLRYVCAIYCICKSQKYKKMKRFARKIPNLIFIVRATSSIIIRSF